MKINEIPVNLRFSKGRTSCKNCLWSDICNDIPENNKTCRDYYAIDNDATDSNEYNKCLYTRSNGYEKTYRPTRGDYGTLVNRALTLKGGICY